MRSYCRRVHVLTSRYPRTGSAAHDQRIDRGEAAKHSKSQQTNCSKPR